MIPLVDGRRICPRADPPAAVSGEVPVGWITLEPVQIADNRLIGKAPTKSI
jgi:hypothetical protein